MKPTQVTSRQLSAIFMLLMLALIFSGNGFAAPTITGEPIIVQHIGKLD